MNRDEFIQKLEENQQEDIEIVKAKNQDYADGADPFQNFRMVEDAGLMTLEEGIAVRMSDKLQRVFNLLDEDAAVDDETIADTLSDLRNYANILQVKLESESNEKTSQEDGSFREMKLEDIISNAENMTTAELKETMDELCYSTEDISPSDVRDHYEKHYSYDSENPEPFEGEKVRKGAT